MIDLASAKEIDGGASETCTLTTITQPVNPASLNLTLLASLAAEADVENAEDA